MRNDKLTKEQEDQKLFDAASNFGPDQIVTSTELAKELEKNGDVMTKSMTGMESLDRLLDGVEAGELVVVTGPTGEGKTTLLMTITSYLAKMGIGSLWFTLEVTPRQFLNKITKGNSMLPEFLIPKAGFEDVPPEWVQTFKKERRREFEMIDWIEYRIIEAKIKSRLDMGEWKGRTLDVIFIDHIHMIFSIAKVERNVSLEIGDMVAEIKNMALKHNVAIFLVAHSKDTPDGSNREPRKEDIRDSGLISRLADTIIGVWRIRNDDEGDSTRRSAIDENDYKSKIRVFKNRREGKLGWFVAYHHNHQLTEDAFVKSDI